MKYEPQFPQRFGSIQDAKAFCRRFFDWYNQDHHVARQTTLDGAFTRNPERFVRKEPQPPAKPIATWINPPQKTLNIRA